MVGVTACEASPGRLYSGQGVHDTTLEVVLVGWGMERPGKLSEPLTGSAAKVFTMCPSLGKMGSVLDYSLGNKLCRSPRNWELREEGDLGEE